jgi:hypothetical protein
MEMVTMEEEMIMEVVTMVNLSQNLNLSQKMAVVETKVEKVVVVETNQRRSHNKKYL